MPKGSKKSYREQYEEVEKAMGKPPPELEGLPELPECAEHVWNWFSDLSNRRTYHSAGGNPITWEAIEAWSRLRGLKLRQWEIDCLFGIDCAYLKSNTSTEE